MAKKKTAETEPVEPTATAEQPLPEPAFFTEEPEDKSKESDEDDEIVSAGLSPEQRAAKREAKKPKIDHLTDAVGVLPDGTKIALFDVGDRIIVQRNLSWALDQWLDTRVYIVRSIDDDKGFVHCQDDEMGHYACVGFKHPGQLFKFAPKKGNPFKAPKVEKPTQPDLPPGEKKRRGRPKGTKNRTKDVIQAEKQAKKEGKAA